VPPVFTGSDNSNFASIKMPLGGGLPRGLNDLLQLRQSGDHTLGGDRPLQGLDP
jgi:hypothetical protein